MTRERKKRAGSSVSEAVSAPVALLVARATLLAYPELLPELVSRIEGLRLRALLFFLEREGDVDAAMRAVAEERVCAAIVAARPTEESITRLQRRRIPLILYNCFSRNAAATTVSCDHAQCGRTIAALLTNGGHRRFGIIGAPGDSTVGEERISGVLEVLKAHGAPPPRIVAGDYSYSSGGPCLDKLFSQMKPRPSAIIAANDAMAIGALDRAVNRGIRVPRDLSIVGFDGTEAAGWPSHRLTTMRQPLTRMADAAAELLAKLLEDPVRPPETRLFAAELVHGGTARFSPRRRGAPPAPETASGFT